MPADAPGLYRHYLYVYTAIQGLPGPIIIFNAYIVTKPPILKAYGRETHWYRKYSENVKDGYVR
jgi:hypothetical protein